ncbi:microtubule-associated protein 9 isoform X4 [Chelonoidis abingdonii]|uniref:microtubule-associated protein 9 isoform X4 n=1 Tax=Chelonoidis abingdonii TaxID=106734 RepID=UPI003F492A20
MSDEDIGTTLAYTKSPKVSKRTTFQNELQEAISARAARQQTVEYSDDFDSDEDDDETTQKKALLKSEIADDLTSLLHEEKLQQMTVLKSQNLSGDREDETECLFIEKLTYHGNEGDHCNESHMAVLQNEREEITQHEFENKPVPKLREQRIKNISSAENVSISALDDHYKPSPQPRSVLRKSSHVEDKDVARAEDKASSSYRLSSFSAPSSLTRLSDIITTSEKRALAESPSPEGPWLTSPPPPFPIHFHSADEISGDSSLLMCGEGSPSKGQDQTEDDDCRDLKLENNGRKSPSVIELMMTTVYEKTKKLQKSSDYQLEENLQTLKEKFIADGIKEMSLNDKSEDMAEVSTSEDSDKKEFEYKETLSQKVRPSSSRSLSSTYLKKAGKTIPPSTTTSSQYLGTLKVLDNKHLQKYSAELDKADSLRAAVYQDWLEKKRVFLLELQRIKRNKAENLKNANEKKEATKKEEAIASFEAWKAMKEKEAKKKLAEKKKLEELKKQRAAEQNEEKKEEAQKAAFEKWKEKKAEYLREQSRKEKRAERIKKKKEEEAIAEKKRDSISAVDKWNEKKEEFVKQKKTEKIQEKRQQEIEQVKREEKDKRAMEEYERWLEEPPLKGQLSTAQNQQRLEAAPAAKEKKERRDQIEKKQKKLQVILEDENPPPWSPPGKAVSSRNY